MKLQDHPLWPTIRDWASSSPLKAVAFAPVDAFQRNIDSLILKNPIWGYEEAIDTFWQEYQNAELLRRALIGDPYCIEAHHILYQMSAHRLGGALCLAAAHASQDPGWFRDFSESTRVDGFEIALKAWARHFLEEEFNGKNELKWVMQNLVGKDEVGADFWLAACQQAIGNSAEYVKSSAEEFGRSGAAARMKKKRGRESKPSKFKDLLQALWVPAALWCKSNEQIVSILAPEQKEDMMGAYRRVARDITDLGFTSSRRKSP